MLLIRRHLAALTVGSLAMSVAVAATSTAAVGAATPTGTTSVTVFLKAPDPAGLDRLAVAKGLTRAQRLRAVSTLVPSTATHDAVGNVLRANGFRVVSATSWSVTATGAAAAAASLFGTRPSLGAHPSRARRLAATGPLSRVPASLANVVAAAYPTTGGAAPFHHAATGALTGQDFRNADTPAGVTPSTGANDAGRTIATLQLADFHGTTPGFANSQTAADLTHYATDHALTDPVANGHYKAVKVDGGPSLSDDAGSGDIEVDLDQESILSTAPSANQHAYFAPNTEAGFDDVFANVYDDVVGNSHAQLPDPHLTALSVSWGSCESDNTATTIAVLEPILKSLVGAGVTVFASSGDDGIYDCRSGSQADVDYPASSPEVISTGGSRLSAATSAPNNGTNWTESAWSCSSPFTCENTTGGTGGGASGSAHTTATDSFAGFAAPAYQRAAIANAPFKGNAKRLVPDITADGDPETGFVIYTSDIAHSGGSSNPQYGGTSLAAPISAAQLTNALSDAGRTTGVGDIHGALYSAYAQTRTLANTNPARVFRDVTVGTNGDPADKGTDPSVSAQVGFDTVSGVGAVLWKALVPYLVDTNKPTVSGSLTETSPRTSAWRQVKATWSAARGADKNLLGPTLVKIAVKGSSGATFSSSAMAASGSHTITASPGRTYVLTVTATDIAGRKSATVTRTLSVPIDDTKFAFSAHWTRTKNSSDLGGSHVGTSTKGAWARVTGFGRTFAVRVDTGPNRGRLGVYLGSKLVKTLDLYTHSYGRATKTIYSSSTRANRTFYLKALGTKSASSHGTGVYLDGVNAAY